MKKLYLLLDEWDNDRNFVGKELELITDKYDVTVICNSAKENLDPKVRYSIYSRPGKLNAISSITRMLFDKDAWSELGRVLGEKSRKAAKLSEVIRFYINADMFRSYMKNRGYLENNAIYYSYWYFWKCYAVTREIDKYPDSRVITRTHEYDLYDYTSPSGYQPFKETMDEKLSGIIFIAEHGRDYYLKKYNKASERKYMLYRLGTSDPMDHGSEFIKDSESDKEKAEDAGAKKNSIKIVSCSSIIERKRVYRIAEALSLINDMNISWIHFGTGEQEEALKALCEEKLSKKDNISVELKGYIKNEELHGFYRRNRIDLFVSASSSEGNPVSVMEALSYGIPVIAPAICNFPNMIQDCGILVSGECRAEELAAAIRRFAGMSADEYRNMRNNARKCWEEKFDADKNNRKFVEEVIDRL